MPARLSSDDWTDVATPITSPLAGRAAIVTGASRRIAIGAAIVRRLVSDGAAVLVHTWSPHDTERGYQSGEAEQLVAELRAGGGRVEHVSADLADPHTPAQLVAAATAAFGRLDILVANHALSSEQSLENLTAAEIDLTFAVNTRATLLLVKEFAGHYEGPTGGPRGITVNCVNPGPNNTGYGDDQMWATVAERNPGGRASTPEDAARLVAWLVNDEAGWVTGQVIASDGGWSTLGA